MADEAGALNEAVPEEETKKKIIKYVVIAVIVLAIGFVVWKFVLKK